MNSSLIQTTRTAAMRERQRIEVQLQFNDAGLSWRRRTEGAVAYPAA